MSEKNLRRNLRFSFSAMLWAMSVLAYCFGLFVIGTTSAVGGDVLAFLATEIGHFDVGLLLMLGPWPGVLLSSGILAVGATKLGRIDTSWFCHVILMGLCFALPRFISYSSLSLPATLVFGGAPLIAVPWVRGSFNASVIEAEKGTVVTIALLIDNCLALAYLVAIRVSVDV